ncbi:MAG: enoyl-CoA hydratase/isomerase family protein [Candidatus Calescibacterium sp.]|nr:enoyl-CoA hydratase/isomerase family protein [Candidatus Calescibacterium sp.]MCX7733909.1 enoyl-CoA hydratase/isomerase family protein [bacterium]MDW8086493.1 enoyl-CoA hydratase/isomerase family protein [Candidatus Calescibacterium sp.]
MSWEDFNARSQKIKVEEIEDVVVIKLNSPENLNAISSKMLEELNEVIDMIWYLENKSGVIFIGEGKAFSAGADVNELYALPNIHQAFEYLRRGQKIFSKIENLKYLTVAAIDGWALGGGFELALSCTFRVMTKSAKVGLPEINLGILPGYGGTQRLSRLIGVQKAKKIIMEGRFIDSQEALEIGIADQTCENKESLIKTSFELLKKFRGKNQTALRYINELCNISMIGGTDQNFKTEALFCASALSTQFAKSKISEFLEKRKK